MDSEMESREKILKGLGPVRWLRSAGLFALLFPVLLTLSFVIANKISPGSTAFLVSGASWTHRFWSLLFYTFAAGAFLLFVNLARVCPRCGEGFFKRQGWQPKKSRSIGKGSGFGFNVNTFSRKCLNCGLKIDGSNIDD